MKTQNILKSNNQTYYISIETSGYERYQFGSSLKGQCFLSMIHLLLTHLDIFIQLLNKQKELTMKRFYSVISAHSIISTWSIKKTNLPFLPNSWNWKWIWVNEGTATLNDTKDYICKGVPEVYQTWKCMVISQQLEGFNLCYLHMVIAARFNIFTWKQEICSQKRSLITITVQSDNRTSKWKKILIYIEMLKLKNLRAGRVKTALTASCAVSQHKPCRLL